MGTFPTSGPGRPDCAEPCGQLPTHSFTLPPVRIFRRVLPSHSRVNEMLSIVFCLVASLFTLEGEEKLLIILYFSHTLTKKNHIPEKRQVWI